MNTRLPREEESVQLEARRAVSRDRMWGLRANLAYRTEAAAAKQRRRAEDPEFRARESERRRLNDQQRRASDPGYRFMDNFQRRVRQSMSGADSRFQREFLGVEFGHSCRVCDRTSCVQ